MKSATSNAVIRRFGKPPVPILASVVAGATPAVCSDSSCVCFLMAFLPARGGAEAGSTPRFMVDETEPVSPRSVIDLKSVTPRSRLGARNSDRSR
jgi:hypothetical protein